MTETTTPRPHRRAVGQLLLGLLPLLAVGLVLLVVLALRLPVAQRPLAEATATATATVTATGAAPAGRGVDVTFPDAEGREREARLVLRAATSVPAGTEVPVAYDPDAGAGGRTLVYADGDAAHGAVADIVFGLVVVVLVLLVAGALTALRVLGARRLRRAPPVQLPATHLTVRRGLLVRSWLELDTPRGLRWVPVHWAPGLTALRPGTRVEVRGDPARDRRVLPVVGGAEVWAAGRVRAGEPRGTVVTPGPAPATPQDAGLGRQARSDAVAPVLAPVLGLLWAYVDGSGVAGFVIATALAAAVLFWLPQLLGSAPGTGDA